MFRSFSGGRRRAQTFCLGKRRSVRSTFQTTAAEGGGEAQESYESEKGGDRELVRDLTKVLPFLKKSVFDAPFIYSITEELRYFETLTSLQWLGESHA